MNATHTGNTSGVLAAVVRRSRIDWYSRRSCLFFGQDANGTLCPGIRSAVPARFTLAFWTGSVEVSSWICGKLVLPNTIRWKGLRGAGKASMAHCSRRPWLENRSAPTRRIGEKRGSKRHLLVDGRGVPLSIIVTGANVNDISRIEAVLDGAVVQRSCPPRRRSKHLCADAGYRSQAAREAIERRGYIPHVVDRRKEAELKRRQPGVKARRWVVEVCHSWFNRFRKLLIRYEKLDRSFIALNHLAAAIIAFRKADRTTIYG